MYQLQSVLTSRRLVVSKMEKSCQHRTSQDNHDGHEVNEWYSCIRIHFYISFQYQFFTVIKISELPCDAHLHHPVHLQIHALYLVYPANSFLLGFNNGSLEWWRISGLLINYFQWKTFLIVTQVTRAIWDKHFHLFGYTFNSER